MKKYEICNKDLESGFLVERECVEALKAENEKLRAHIAELKKVIKADLAKIEELTLKTAYDPADEKKLWYLCNTRTLTLGLDPLKWERTLIMSNTVFKGESLEELVNAAYEWAKEQAK